MMNMFLQTFLISPITIYIIIIICKSKIRIAFPFNKCYFSVCLFFQKILLIARKRDSDHGAPQLLLPFLPTPRDAAHLHLPSNHIPHSGGFCYLTGPRTPRGETAHREIFFSHRCVSILTRHQLQQGQIGFKFDFYTTTDTDGWCNLMVNLSKRQMIISNIFF